MSASFERFIDTAVDAVDTANTADTLGTAYAVDTADGVECAPSCSHIELEESLAQHEPSFEHVTAGDWPQEFSNWTEFTNSGFNCDVCTYVCARVWPRASDKAQAQSHAQASVSCSHCAARGMLGAQESIDDRARAFDQCCETGCFFVVCAPCKEKQSPRFVALAHQRYVLEQIATLTTLCAENVFEAEVQFFHAHGFTKHLGCLDPADIELFSKVCEKWEQAILQLALGGKDTGIVGVSQAEAIEYVQDVMDMDISLGVAVLPKRDEKTADTVDEHKGATMTMSTSASKQRPCSHQQEKTQRSALLEAVKQEMEMLLSDSVDESRRVAVSESEHAGEHA